MVNILDKIAKKILLADLKTIADNYGDFTINIDDNDFSIINIREDMDFLFSRIICLIMVNKYKLLCTNI